MVNTESTCCFRVDFFVGNPVPETTDQLGMAIKIGMIWGWLCFEGFTTLSYVFLLCLLCFIFSNIISLLAEPPMLPAGDSRSPRLHGAVFARPSHPQAALHVFLTVFGQEDHLGAGRSDIMSEQNGTQWGPKS